MIQLGIFAKTFEEKTVDSLMNKIKTYDIENVHYNMSCSGISSLPSSISPNLITNLNNTVNSREMNIVGVSATFNMIHPDGAVREAGLNSLEVLAKASKNIGNNLLTLCTGSRNIDNKWEWHQDNLTKEAWKDLLDIMDKAIQIAEQYDVLLGIEPEIANIIQTPQKARKLIDELQSDRIKIILDPANLFETAISKMEIKDHISKAFELLHEDMAIAHAKDKSLDGSFKAAGKGDIDFVSFTYLLRQLKFDIPLIMHGLESEEVAFSSNYLKRIINASI